MRPWVLLALSLIWGPPETSWGKSRRMLCTMLTNREWSVHEREEETFMLRALWSSRLLKVVHHPRATRWMFSPNKLGSSSRKCLCILRKHRRANGWPGGFAALSIPLRGCICKAHECLMLNKELTWPTVIYHISTVFIQVHWDREISSYVLFILALSTKGIWHTCERINASAFLYQ